MEVLLVGQDVEWDFVLFQLLLLSHWELELTAEGRLPSVPAPEQRKSLGQHPSSGPSREKKNPLSQPSPQLPRVHRKLWGQQLRELLEVLQPLSGHCCDNRVPLWPWLLRKASAGAQLNPSYRLCAWRMGDRL